jgi:hypothetical protein
MPCGETLISVSLQFGDNSFCAIPGGETAIPHECLILFRVLPNSQVPKVPPAIP